jgi:Ca2+-binding EF-hand superfamily protein
MKTACKTVILGGLVLACAAGTLFAQPGMGPRPESAPRMGGPRPHGPPPEVVQKYDLDQDGILNETERAKLHQDMQEGKVQRPPLDSKRPPHRGSPPKEFVEKYDANQDGKLDETEHAAIRKDIADGKLQPPPRGRMGGHAGPPKELLETYDVNQDGVLDQSERAALRQDVEDGKIQAPPRRRHGPVSHDIPVQE